MKENSLTERQVRLAEEHYGELSRFLSAHNLSEDKFYDVVVFGFLDAVREYDECGDATFRRVAEHHMKNSLRMHFEEQREKESLGVHMLSLDYIIPGSAGLRFGDTVADESVDVFAEVCRRMKMRHPRKYRLSNKEDRLRVFKRRAAKGVLCVQGI